jgi:CubicO group peptidase (beta-lactamase class C family)
MRDRQRYRLADERPLSEEGRKSGSVFRNLLCLGAAALSLGRVAPAISCQQETESIRSHEAAEFDRVLRQFARFGFSGVVLVLKDGDSVLSRSYGFSRREEGIRNTVNTPFPIASVTKQFVAAAILRLQMDGKLRTSDPVSKYLGKFPGQLGEPTVEELLTHTSGIIHPETSFVSRSGTEFVKKLKTFPRESEPGKYRYSNGGYSLLAAIIEQASGMPFEVYLQKKLFQPADMACTGFTITPETALGYEMDEKWLSEAGSPSLLRRILGIGYQPEFRLARPILDDWSIRTSGGIITTLSDIERWERAFKKNYVLSMAAIEAMLMPRIPVPPSDREQAYSWMIERTPSGRRVAYGYGDYWGYQAAYVRHLDDRCTLFVATNISVGRGPQGWRPLVRHSFEKTFHLEQGR